MCHPGHTSPTFLFEAPFRNRALDIGSRTIRNALRTAAQPSLVLHAGDLVNQREIQVHDDEWGEWTAAGGYSFAMVPQLPVAGNHEYVDVLDASGEEIGRSLSPHWTAQFVLPRNGAPAVEETTYWVDHQGVRFIVLDGAAALDLDARDAQTAWLDRILSDNPNSWTVLSVHQPLFTCSRPVDTEPLKQAWQAMIIERRVDLVLQGHDHCYSRISDPMSGRREDRMAAPRDLPGPVYVVSVTGCQPGIRARHWRSERRQTIAPDLLHSPGAVIRHGISLLIDAPPR